MPKNQVLVFPKINCVYQTILTNNIDNTDKQRSNNNDDNHNHYQNKTNYS